MIHDRDRSNYFGASDTAEIMGNWSTESFKKFWAVKKGEIENVEIDNIYTQTGNKFESHILDYIQKVCGENIERDKQILIEDRHIRVNLDGNTKDTIYEVKTHKSEWKTIDDVDERYLMQVRYQMYASKLIGEEREVVIVGYKLNEEDYEIDEKDIVIDKNRITLFPIVQDEKWLAQFVKRLNYLAECLDFDFFPNETLTFSDVPVNKDLGENFIKNFNKAELMIARIESELKDAKKKAEEFRSAIKDYMKKNDMKSFKTDLLTVSYTSEYDTTVVDSDKLKKEYPEVFENCKKLKHTSDSIRIKVKE